MTNKIRVGLIGIGNCAKSIVEGTQYYNENPDDRVGLMYPDIGGYTVHDLQFVVGFDVDPRKVNKPLKEALRANPNCAMDHVRELLDTGEHAAIETGAMVHCVPTHDGVAPWMLEFPEDVSFRVTDQPSLTREAVIEKLQELKVDVLVNYLPVGSEDGTRWWLDIALEAGIHFVNYIPAVIGTDEVRDMVDAIIYRKFNYDGELTLIERGVSPDGKLGDTSELEIDKDHPLASLTFSHVLLMSKPGDETYELLASFLVKDTTENEPAIIDHLTEESIEVVVDTLIKSYQSDQAPPPAAH